jgi:hypothetical protein
MGSDTRQLIVPEPHYTLFNAQREGLPEVIVVNDALLKFPHNDIFPWHLRISIDANELADNGMPTNGESKILFDVGDQIEKVILSSATANNAPNAQFLARSTWNEFREIYFVVHDPEIAHKALQDLLSTRNWPRPWEYHMSEDREWKKAGYIFQLFTQAGKRDA